MLAFEHELRLQLLRLSHEHHACEEIQLKTTDSQSALRFGPTWPDRVRPVTTSSLYFKEFL